MKFGEYLPDIPARDNPGLTVAKNCIPHAVSYKPFSDKVAFSGAVNSTCLGAIGVKSTSGNSYNYCGTSTKLYSLGGSTWSDVTRSSGGDYSVEASQNWEFADWGNQVVAVGGVGVAPQVITKGGANFAALSGSPPQARHVGIVQGFLVLGAINDGATKPTTLHWSAIEDITGWTAGTDQSDTQDLISGGEIMRVIGGEYGIVFCRESIHRMEYAGPPTIFNIHEIEPGKGTPASQSVVQNGSIIFYLGRDGFYMFNGTSSIPIGANRVDKTFYSDLDQSYMDKIWGVVDPINNIVFWSYPGSGNSGIANKIIAYNWSTNRWSGPIEMDTEILYNARTTGYTLDQLTTVLGYTNMETLPYSLDSRYWQGGSIIMACFDSDHKMSTFQGDPLEATLETGEFMPNPDGRSIINGVRPLVDGTSATVKCQIGSRNDGDESVTWSGLASQNSQTGMCNFRANARYHRARMKITGGFSHAFGFDVDAVGVGKK